MSDSDDIIPTAHIYESKSFGWLINTIEGSLIMVSELAEVGRGNATFILFLSEFLVRGRQVAQFMVHNDLLERIEEIDGKSKH